MFYLICFNTNKNVNMTIRDVEVYSGVCQSPVKFPLGAGTVFSYVHRQITQTWWNFTDDKTVEKAKSLIADHSSV